MISIKTFLPRVFICASCGEKSSEPNRIEEQPTYCQALQASAWFYSSEKKECFYASWNPCGPGGPPKPEGREYKSEEICRSEIGTQNE